MQAVAATQTVILMLVVIPMQEEGAGIAWDGIAGIAGIPVVAIAAWRMNGTENLMACTELNTKDRAVSKPLCLFI